MILHAIVLEKDAPTVAQLSGFFENYPEIRLTGSFNDLYQLNNHRLPAMPDLAFISEDFLGNDPTLISEILVNQFGQIPAIIFIGNTPDHAWDALEAGAIDYLLRPLRTPRLYTCLCKILQLSVNLDTMGILQSFIHNPPSTTRQHFLQQLMIRDGDDILFVDCKEIRWLESARNYVKVHTGRESYLFRGTLQSLEENLDPRHFVRIHRSYLVNRDHIFKLQSWSNGDYILFLKDKTELMLSRKYRHHLFSQLSGTETPTLLQQQSPAREQRSKVETTRDMPLTSGLV
ncbi:MAG: response regulator transcription factor [Calditrichaeota bacterium]|nr:response regulator transcription factor [Calditrichota bacterium]